MKKLLLSFTVLLVTASVFAKTWESNVGVGFTVPFSITGVDEKGADDIKQLGFGAEGFYLGRHENGFTVKGGYTVAGTASRDVAIQNHKTNFGVFSSGSVGAGYSFTPSDNMIISLCGMFGIDASVFDHDEDFDDGDSEFEHSLALVTANAGIDLFARYTISEHFGFFANVSARYIIGGWGIEQEKNTYETSNDRKKTDTAEWDTDLLGGFRIQPSVGVCWRF